MVYAFALERLGSGLLSQFRWSDDEQYLVCYEKTREKRENGMSMAGVSEKTRHCRGSSRRIEAVWWLPGHHRSIITL